MRICPNCGKGLSRTRGEHGHFWHCEACTGRHVSVSYLRRLTRTKTISKLWIEARALEDAPERDCPTCHRRMKEVSVTVVEGHKLPLDVCTVCHYVWFDPREIDELPSREIDLEQVISLEAREALAKAYMARIERQAMLNSDLDEEVPFWMGVLLLLFPIEEEHLTRRAPWVTVILLGLISVVGLATLGNLSATGAEWGLSATDPWRHTGLTFITSFFLQPNLWFLLGNLYFLWSFGDNVEDYLGRAWFVVLLALSSLAGAVTHIAFAANPGVPIMGASAGISGILAFYALKFPHVKLTTARFRPFSGLDSPFRFVFLLTEIPAWIGFTIWVELQALLIYLQSQDVGVVSAYAHLGGAGVGLLLWLVWRRKEA